VLAADVWEWQRFATCRTSDTSIFYSHDGERGQARAHRVQAAKAICRRCPVLMQCRTHALATAEVHGIWGGLTEIERRGIPK